MNGLGTYEQCCRGKKRLTKKLAKRAASALARRNGQKMQWYKCPFCSAAGEWHCYHVGTNVPRSQRV